MKINGIEIVGPEPPKGVRDIRGLKFNRLTCFGYVGRIDISMRHIWKFRCECGSEIERMSNGVTGRKPNVKSCGCLVKETTLRLNTTHGLSRTKEYFVWKSMIKRCENVNDPQYLDYGGRGIKVCDQWKGKNGFTQFMKDLGPRPEGMTVERRENNDGYNPSNCYWSSRKEQNRNKRNNVALTYKGVTKCHAEWEEELGFKPDTISYRIRSGWTVERAIETPARKFKKKER